MSGRPWYKRYPSDFIGGTLGLSLEEKGAYSLILDLIYDRGDSVPDDARYLAGICGCSVRKWNAIRERLITAGKIVIEDGAISNSRADKELEISSKNADERAESGRKGGEKRAENAAALNKNNDIAQAELKHTRAFQKLDTESPQSPPVGGMGPDDALFEEIWKVFPRAPTSNQRAARRQFNMLTPDQRKALLKAAQRFRAWWIDDCRKRGEPQDARLRYVPHLATWIQNGAWESADDLPVYGGFEAKKVEGITYVARLQEPELFSACERLEGAKISPSLPKYGFSSDLVERARQQLRSAA